MAEVWFYHLETSPLVESLPELLEKAQTRGWRAYVHCPDDMRRQKLDEYLWAYRPESFLAHADEAVDFAEDQPVLLGASGKPVNGAQMFVSVSPADLPPLEGFARTLIMFEDSDEAHLNWARQQWKRLKGDTIALSYWKQNGSGRWEKMN
jgi:DNA polymerase III subunit chi